MQPKHIRQASNHSGCASLRRSSNHFMAAVAYGVGDSGKVCHPPPSMQSVDEEIQEIPNPQHGHCAGQA